MHDLGLCISSVYMLFEAGNGRVRAHNTHSTLTTSAPCLTPYLLLYYYYKVLLLTHKCINGHAPPYLQELITPQTSNRTLRSTNSSLLRVPNTKLRTMGDRAFCSAAPRLWNSLPDHLRATLDSFKTGLKTFLFRKAFLALC